MNITGMSTQNSRNMLSDLDIMGATNTHTGDFKLFTYLLNQNFTELINTILLQK